MFDFFRKRKGRVEELEERVAELEESVMFLEKAVEELKKPTISQRTLESDKPVSPGQILSEWLNGKEEEAEND